MEIIKFNKNSDNLIEKYAPVNIKDIIGAKRQKYAIVEWLKKYDDNARIHFRKQEDKKNIKKTRKRRGTKKLTITSESKDEKNEITRKTKKKDADMCSCMFVTGDHGCGKSSIVKAILNGMGYQIKTINFSRLGNIKIIEDFVKNLLLSSDIFDTISKIRYRKDAILIDEIESLSTPTEKNLVEGLLKMNADLWACPVIFVGSNKHKKIMSTLKEETYHISIYEPTTPDMFELLERIGVGEKMKMEDGNVATKIIKHCQGDNRRLIVILGELKRIYGSNTITNENLDIYLSYVVQKDVDRSIYEYTNKLFTTYEGINPVLKIFENDKTNMPLMVHQNHFLATNNYIKNKNEVIKISSEITENIAHGDIVDNYIYSDQNWNLQEMHGFYTCVYPSYKLNKELDTKKLLAHSQHPYYKPTFSPEYPKDFNRTSTKCINYRNVKFANDYFKNMDIDDYVYANKLIKDLLENDRIEECKKIIQEYKLDYKGIMYVLRIDKINGAKKDISKNMEKKVKEISIEPIRASNIFKKK